MRRTFREPRTVEAGQGAMGEWTSEGGPKKPESALSRDRRVSHPLSIGTRMMVRVSEWTRKRQFGWYRGSIAFRPIYVG